MRLDRLFVLLLSITLVSVSLFYFPSSSQESICRDGEIFNPELSRCEASPICPDGTAFNPDTDRCEQVPQCPTDSVYNKDRDKCEGSPTCPIGGTLDDEGCKTNPILNCEFEGVEGVLVGDKCEIPLELNELVCPGRQIFSVDSCFDPDGDIFTCSLGLEEKRVCSPLVADPLDPSTERPLVPPGFDSPNNSVKSCPGSFSWDIITQRCFLQACVGIYAYNKVEDRCELIQAPEVDCPNGGKKLTAILCVLKSRCDGLGNEDFNGNCFANRIKCPPHSELDEALCVAERICLNGEETRLAAVCIEEKPLTTESAENNKFCTARIGVFKPDSKCPGPDTQCHINGKVLTDVCEASANKVCPEGAKLTNGICLDSTPCPDGFDFVDSGGNLICEGPATCPADTALDTGEDLCLAEFECPEDTIFDANTDLCIRLIVSIDIKPGSDPNCFNNDGKGVIPVAILGSDLFDVTLVDPATVQLDGMGLKAVGKGNKLLASIGDTNGDEFDDLGVKIQDQDGVFSGDGTGTITGELFDKTPFEGTDSVCIRPPSNTQPGQRGIVTDDDSDGQTDDTSFDAVTSDNLAPDNQTVQRGMATDDSDVILDTASFFTVTKDSASPSPQTSDIVTDDKGSGGDEHLTRPTFGLSHENYETIVDSGFRFNDQSFTINDNFHTPFAQQTVNIGEVNSFEAKIYADKGLRVQEFLFGIPNVGEAHLAELGVEVWYDYNGEIEEVKAVQKSNVIDKETIVVTHEKTKCQALDIELKCDTTNVSMVFLEPLKDQVIAVKAIDYKNRFQITYLNEGVEIAGESLNPMNTYLIPSKVKGEGLVQVTQIAKYSPYWVAEDGRIFEMNSFGSFKQTNQTFERFEDTGNPYTRLHSGFGGIIAYEQKRATLLFDSSEYISNLPESFAYLYSESGDRMTEEMKQKMLEQEKIAKKIIEESKVQARWH